MFIMNSLAIIRSEVIYIVEINVYVKTFYLYKSNTERRKH